MNQILKTIPAALLLASLATHALAQPTFTTTVLSRPGSDDPRDVEAADMDGDGDVDLVVTFWNDQGIRWYENEGADVPVFPTIYDINTALTKPDQLFLGDLDNDGDNDVLVGTLDGAYWFQNNGASPPGFTQRLIDDFIYPGASPTGVIDSGVTAADMDNDGDLDVLVALTAEDGTFDGVRIYTNDLLPGGMLTFTETTFAPRAGAARIRAGDLNGDGFKEFITGERPTAGNANRGIFSRWLFNQQTGEYEPSSRIVGDSGTRISSVAIADINGDGFPDLLSTISNLGGGVRRYLHSGNNADPQFIAGEVTVGLGFAEYIDTGDIDGDGDIDIAVASRSNGSWWFRNAGNGTSWTGTNLNSSVNCWGALVVDVDGDTDSDLVYGFPVDQVVRIERNNTFTAPVVNLTSGTQHDDGLLSLFFATLFASDGDTILATPDQVADEPVNLAGKDLAIFSRAEITQPPFRTYFLDGGDTISVRDPEPTRTLGDTTVSLGLKQDFTFAGTITARDEGPGIATLQGARILQLDTGSINIESNAALELRSTITDSDRQFDPSVPPIDLSGDVRLAPGSTLLLSTDRTSRFSGTLITSHNASIIADGAIMFGAPRPPVGFEKSVIDSTVESITDVHAADIDSDGDIDVVVAIESAHTVRWYEKIASDPAMYVAHDVATDASFVKAVHIADIDGDGALDILSASLGNDPVRYYLNDNDGNPSTPATFAEQSVDPMMFFAFDVHGADLNGDKRVDIVATDEFGNTIYWYENELDDPMPGFAFREIATTGVGVRSLFVADVNADGHPDIVTASGFDNAVRWFENNGAPAPSFAERDVFIGALFAHDAIAVNLDSDPELEIISASQDDDTVRLHDTDGLNPPTFTTSVLTNTAAFASGLAAFNPDADGDIDLLVASALDDSVRWYENRGNDPYVEHVIDDNADGAFAVASADIDADGFDDAFGVTLNTGEVIAYQNSLSTIVSPPSNIFVDTGGYIEAQGSIINNATDMLLQSGVLINAPGGFFNESSLNLFGPTIDADFFNGPEAFCSAEMTSVFLYGVTIDGFFGLAAPIAVAGVLTIEGGLFAGGPGSGIFNEGGIIATSGASLTVIDADGFVHVGGDYDIAINDSSRYNLSTVDLQLDGAATRTIEAMSLDIGASPDGLSPSAPGRFPVGTLRIGPGSATVNVIDTHDNANDSQAFPEAIYARNLIIEPGSTLNTNGHKVYYETLTMSGTVDSPANLCPISANTCPADFDNDGDVDLGDFGVFGAAFNSMTGDMNYNPAADFDNDGDVDLGDFGVFGAQFGRTDCLP